MTHMAKKMRIAQGEFTVRRTRQFAGAAQLAGRLVCPVRLFTAVSTSGRLLYGMSPFPPSPFRPSRDYLSINCRSGDACVCSRHAGRRQSVSPPFPPAAPMNPFCPRYISASRCSCQWCVLESFKFGLVARFRFGTCIPDFS